MLLESYVRGRWVQPDDDGRPLLDASTDEVVAHVSTRPAPASEAVAYARAVGVPALAALSYADRAALLKALGTLLMSERDSFADLSYATGATAKDAQIDLDGGFGTLLAYASRGRRELTGDVLVDGPVEPLGRQGTFLAQHVLTSRGGVTVQLNAFNFPVWGMLEKLAPALLAGVPSLVKPAPQTAYLTEAVVRRIVETGLLPDGALQLLVGEPDGLLDQLDPRDSVAFTGSARTGALLRAHPAVLRGVRLTVEADSLNGCVLGPDASPGTPEHELFLTEVVGEVTAKAGQRCTAIRRVLIPRDRLDEVAEALAERLGAVRIGDPRDPDTTMGALVSKAQRDTVTEAIGRLADEGRTLLDGKVDRSRGAFVGPSLILQDDEARAVHEVEAFGPVVTLLPYDTPAHALDLLARGRGSLVTSIVSHDPGFVRTMVLGAAGGHGRLLVLDRDCAAEQTGHGSPLPGLVHGGPGRAGGGEELGGVRAVHHHLQRTAVQGSPDTLTAVTGRYVTGATRRAVGEHPFRRRMSELTVGDAVTTRRRVVSREDVDHFAAFTGDTFYAHTDETAAAANPLFGGIVAHGYLVLSLAAGLFVDPAPGPVLANTGLDRLRFVRPVKPGDAIHVVLTCASLTPRSADQGEVRWDVQVLDDDDRPVATYELLTMVQA